MPFLLSREEITAVKADAVVCPVTADLLPVGGLSEALFHAAGSGKLSSACAGIGPCDAGSAVLTSGFRLPAKNIILTVLPTSAHDRQKEEELLRSCYLSALRLAEEKGFATVACPLLTSDNGLPLSEALALARSVIPDFLARREMNVSLILTETQSESLFQNRNCISFPPEPMICGAALIPEDAPVKYRGRGKDFTLRKISAPKACNSFESDTEDFSEESLCIKDNFTARLGESFSTMLLRLIDQQGLTDVEFYKRANMDRRLFSKIRKEDYAPSKLTAISCCIALRLNADQSRDLLAKAGYAFSDSNLTDLIVEDFIKRCNWDIFEINETLFYYHQRLLGA